MITGLYSNLLPLPIEARSRLGYPKGSQVNGLPENILIK
jgi:hypothetical protein